MTYLSRSTKERRERMSPKLRLYFLFFLVALLFAGLTVIFYYTYAIYEIRMLPVDYHVADHVGINVGVDGLHFGSFLPGGASERYIKLHAFRDTRVIFIFKDIDYVYPESNDFIMKKGDDKNVRFKVIVPVQMPYGDYQGTLKILLQRV